MDYIFIKDLLVKGIIGIYDWERENEQDILINIQCFGDTHNAALSDDLNECIDYENLANTIKKLVKESNRFTLEALAEDIANACLSINSVRKTVVRVEKPGVLPETTSAGVQIERK
jgi:7,8-dihydroneopterin aldolase/epimerase/oxygenase